MQRMNFSSLIETFAVDFQLVLPSVEGAGKYIHGEWFPTTKNPKLFLGRLSHTTIGRFIKVAEHSHLATGNLLTLVRFL